MESYLTEKDRFIYAFNIIPDKWYALSLNCYYGDALGYYSWVDGWHNWSRNIQELIGIYKIPENVEFEVLKFNKPFSYEMKIPYNDPVVNTKEKVAIMQQISALKW